MKQKLRTIEIPDCWQDLTPEDWREILKIRQKVVEHGGRYSEFDITVETARILLKNRGVKLQLNNPDCILLIGQIANSLNWLWHAEGAIISLVYKDTRNLIPKVRNWLGPSDHGADLTFGEFRQAFAHLKTYEQNQTSTALLALAGLLYRPEATPQQKYNQQLRRQPYDWDSTDNKIERGRKMKPWQVWGIYAWFAWFCEYLTTGTFIIDGEEVCFAPVFERKQVQGEVEKGNGSRLQQICLTLAESHVFGTVKDVDHTPLLTVMQKLLMDYQTLQSIKKKRK